MKLNNVEFIKETERRHAGLDSEITNERRKLAPRQLENVARVTERIEHLVENRAEPFDIALERIIGRNDLMSINYFQIGFTVSKSVCRIHVKNENGGNEGRATGFLISPNLLMTNNHVFEKREDTLRSFVEFDYQYTEEGIMSQTHLFGLLPGEFFYTNPKLDYTIVAVNNLSKNGGKVLSDFGFLKLFEESSKALLSENLSIVQHPGGELKQVAIRENQLLEFDPGSPFITYSTDTTQGSSGSPVYNDQWQVVALHHSGVPRKDTAGNWLQKNGQIWRVGMDDNLIDWVSNEGIRISSIISDLKARVPGDKYIIEMLAVTQPAHINSEAAGKKVESLSGSQPLKSNNMSNTVTFNLPIEVSVNIGPNFTPVSTAVGATAQVLNTVPVNFVVERANNQNYRGRNGYQSDFVKAGNFKIELDKLLESQTANLAPILNPTAENKNFLKYFNFSVVIHKYRKLCLLTAVNIDGNRLDPVNRENTKWIMDPRMDERYQTGPSVYAQNDLDRGHMVRRLDPVWGEHANEANDDTFHFTNSAPQHKDLNQKTWLSLENYILNGAGQDRIKASVFTGPVFGPGDKPYRGVLLPLQFWKVAAMIKSDGTPSVTGYLLKQPDSISDFTDREGIRDDGFGEFKTYQVPLQKIANLTGLKFDRFNVFDPLNGVDFNETTRLIEINGTADIKL